jgi:hypothetical protein
MKNVWWIAACIAVFAQWSLAGEPAPISFNLVQVNNYNHNAQAAPDTSAPKGQRVVIDVQNPNALHSMTPAPNAPGNKPSTVNMAASLNPADRGVQLPWESNRILYTASGQDSFLVTSSRTGCPGTEVRPSVSVAFSTSHGWSNPPIRFGPLTDKTVCPLGRGVELHVNAVGSAAPYVKLAESGATYSRR